MYVGSQNLKNRSLHTWLGALEEACWKKRTFSANLPPICEVKRCFVVDPSNIVPM
jgi:hypothetical protein